ncbi:membrane bound O-acyl transferase family protein [Pelomyxa schiedti]|nr:membrane bound O-acyl transferase family protein [Pelomyxa schiedti]
MRRVTHPEEQKERYTDTTSVGKRRSHWPVERESYLESNSRDSVSNSVGLIIAVWIANVLMDNYINKGKLVDFSLLWYLLEDLHIACALNVAFFLYTLLACYTLVKLIAHGVIRGFNWVAYTLYAILQVTLIAGPVFVLYLVNPDWRPLCAISSTMQTAVFSMKAHSYFFTNRHIYEYIHALSRTDRDIGPPERLGLKGVIFGQKLSTVERANRFNGITKFSCFWKFMIYPTLCYYLEYPVLEHISKRKLVLHASQSAVSFFISYVCLVNVCIPAWRTILDRPVVALVRTLIPGFVIWMSMFFGVFHGLLNLVAEIVRYGDRRFYGAWWECRDMQSWWKEWNCCVSDWMRRHMYFQSIQDAKFTSWWAMSSVFTVSALWHEWILMLALRQLRPILSSLILGQIVLIAVTSHPIFRNTRLGNLVIWFAFVVGYPLVLNLYAFSWCYSNPTICHS